MNFPYKLIDLTHTLHQNIPTWEGACGFKHNLCSDYSECEGEFKFRTHKIQMNEGIGTHIDSPSHSIEGGKFIHELDINELCMLCYVIDISGKAHESYIMQREDIINFEKTHGEIMPGSCVLVKTGWEKFWNDSAKYHNNYIFPSISLSAAELFLSKGVEALGIDTLSPDRPDQGFPVHQLFLGRGKILIENVANLDKMPKAGAYIMILPLKIQNGTEAPIRLVGLI